MVIFFIFFFKIFYGIFCFLKYFLYLCNVTSDYQGRFEWIYNLRISCPYSPRWDFGQWPSIRQAKVSDKALGIINKINKKNIQISSNFEIIMIFILEGGVIVYTFWWKRIFLICSTCLFHLPSFNWHLR